MKLELRGKDSTIVGVVEARKFEMVVDGHDYWLAYHQDTMHHLIVSDIESGYRVCVVSYGTRAACMDDKAAAKVEVQRLIDRVGTKRFREVIDGAIVKA